MDIASKTVTTRVHTAVATPDDIKGVAILAVTRKLGLAAEAIVSSSAEVGADGSVKIEVVEAVPDAPKPDPAPPSQAAAAPIV